MLVTDGGWRCRQLIRALAYAHPRGLHRSRVRTFETSRSKEGLSITAPATPQTVLRVLTAGVQPHQSFADRAGRVGHRWFAGDSVFARPGVWRVIQLHFQYVREPGHSHVMPHQHNHRDQSPIAQRVPRAGENVVGHERSGDNLIDESKNGYEVCREQLRIEAAEFDGLDLLRRPAALPSLAKMLEPFRSRCAAEPRPAGSPLPPSSVEARCPQCIRDLRKLAGQPLIKQQQRPREVGRKSPVLFLLGARKACRIDQRQTRHQLASTGASD